MTRTIKRVCLVVQCSYGFEGVYNGRDIYIVFSGLQSFHLTYDGSVTNFMKLLVEMQYKTNLVEEFNREMDKHFLPRSLGRWLNFQVVERFELDPET